MDFVSFEFIRSGAVWGRREDAGRVSLKAPMAGVSNSQVGKGDQAGTKVLPVPFGKCKGKQV